MTNAYLLNIERLSSHPDVKCIISVDAKTNLSQFSSEPFFREVHLDPRVNVDWGQYSQVLATVSLMRKSLDYNYDYFSFLSGDDIFVSTIEKFSSFLNRHNGIDFIDINVSPFDKATIYRRCAYEYTASDFNRNKNLFEACRDYFRRECYLKLKPRSLEVSALPVLAKGSNWFTVTRSFVREFLAFYAKNSTELESFFKSSLCSDEILIQSFAASFRFEGTSSNIKDFGPGDERTLRYVDWKTGPSYPKFLNYLEIERAMNLDNVFFVRKVSRDIHVNRLRHLISMKA